MQKRIWIIGALIGCLLPTHGADAGGMLGLRGMTMTGGLVTEGSSLCFGGRADLGQINEQVSVDLGLLYWRWSQSATAYGFTASGSLRDLVILPGVTYRFPLENSQITPFAQGGLGLHLFKASWEGRYVYYNEGASYSASRAGLYLGGGADYKTARGFLIGAYLNHHLVEGGWTEIGARVTFSLR